MMNNLKMHLDADLRRFALIFKASASDVTTGHQRRRRSATVLGFCIEFQPHAELRSFLSQPSFENIEHWYPSSRFVEANDGCNRLPLSSGVAIRVDTLVR